MPFGIFNKKPLNIKNNVYALASTGNDSVELTFYGDVVAEVPTDWYGDPIEGDYIVMSDFVKDLDRITGYRNITIRMNSYGGDCMAGFVIHNRLRELANQGHNITCIVDGVAMSAASLIMSACNTVRVNPASLIMVHRCWSYIWGGYNADELRGLADQNASYDKAIATAYARKTGISETEILQMMSDTTYMTGQEAVEKGFADELIEDAEPLNIAASADGRSLFIRGREMHLAPGMFAPDNIPTINPENTVTPASENPEADGNNTPVASGTTTTQGGSSMTRDELNTQYPDLVADIVADAQASQTDAIQNAVEAERQRLSEIDQIANLYPSDAVNDAKYGEHACSAAEFALRMAQQQATQGNSFMQQMNADTQASGANAVPAASANPENDMKDDGTKEMSETESAEFIHNIFKKEEK